MQTLLRRMLSTSDESNTCRVFKQNEDVVEFPSARAKRNEIKQVAHLSLHYSLSMPSCSLLLFPPTAARPPPSTSLASICISYPWVALPHTLGLFARQIMYDSQHCHDIAKNIITVACLVENLLDFHRWLSPVTDPNNARQEWYSPECAMTGNPLQTWRGSGLAFVRSQRQNSGEGRSCSHDVLHPKHCLGRPV